MSKLKNLIRYRFFWYSEANILEAPLESLEIIPAKIPVNFRFGDLRDLERMDNATYDYDDRAKKFFRERLKKGDRLVVAEHEGEIAFYSWVMFGEMDLLYGQIVPISKDRAYSYKAYTLDKYRGKGLHKASKGFLKRQLGTMGVRRLITQTDKDNVAANRVHEKSGSKVVGVVGEFQVLGKPICFLNSKIKAYLNSAPE